MLLALACSGGSKQVRPEAGLAESAASQAAFRELRVAWYAASAEERARLEPKLREFLAQFPGDRRADTVRLWLAWSYTDRGAVKAALALVKDVQSRAGSVRDFAAVVHAKILLREGQPEQALRVLYPLAGKIIDPDERLLFGETRLRAAATARHFEEAMQAAQELLARATTETRATAESALREVAQSAKKDDLVASLIELDQAAAHDNDTERAAARDWLRRLLRERLTELAISGRDAALARSLIDSARGSERGGGDAPLAVVANGGRTLPQIAGRALGLVLAMSNADVRRRSVSVAAGVSRALGLPDSLSDAKGVRLLTQDDAGSAAGLLNAMSELAASGAAILVAGMDGEMASHAARFAQNSGVALMLIAPPADAALVSRNTFLLGEGAHSEEALALSELNRRHLARFARIDNGASACDPTAPAPRFAIDEWRRDKVLALLMFGDAGCASDLAVELRKARLSVTLGLGLEASQLLATGEVSNPSFGIGAGKFPRVEPAQGGTGALPGLAPLDWYEALGHDAAALAEVALAGFPEGSVVEPQQVAALQRQASRELKSAHADLWTTDERGFSADGILPRTLRVISKSTAPLP
ncbi:MAG TPA: hypothetical protein VGI10_29580 [Polyangiaceae bacterium]